jgi:hypothetical protein
VFYFEIKRLFALSRCLRLRMAMRKNMKEHVVSYSAFVV